MKRETWNLKKNNNNKKKKTQKPNKTEEGEKIFFKFLANIFRLTLKLIRCLYLWLTFF